MIRQPLTLSVLDGGQLLVHGLVCGFGKSFSCGTITVVHQVGGHHPDGNKHKEGVSVPLDPTYRAQQGQECQGVLEVC